MKIKLKVEDFSSYYKKLSILERNRVRNEFLEKTGLAYPSWYSKLSSGHFSKLEQSLLEDICDLEIVI